jgi:hypothetical protein
MLSSITHRRVSRKRIQILGFLSQVYDKGNWYYFSWGWFESPTIDAYTSNCTLNLPPAWLHKRQSSRAARFHSHPMNPYLIISCLSHSCVRYRAECRGGLRLDRTRGVRSSRHGHGQGYPDGIRMLAGLVFVRQRTGGMYLCENRNRVAHWLSVTDIGGMVYGGCGNSNRRYHWGCSIGG